MKKPAKQKKVTQSDLAKQLGISRQLVAHHQKTGKAPALDDLSGWVAYLAACGREGSVPKQYREEVAKQKVRILTATADKLEFEKAEKRKMLLERGNVFRFLNRLMNELFFGELERLKTEFASSLVGKDAAGISMAVDAQIDVVRERLAKGLENWEAQNSETTGR